MPERSGFALVLTTAGSDEQAKRIAETLVERRLAACVNIVPKVVSVYRWKDKVTHDDERLLVIKTAERLFPEVRAAIREVHSYELPEIVMIRIADGDAGYLDWLAESLGDVSQEGV